MKTDELKKKLISEIETKINTRALTCEELKDLCIAFKELRSNEYLVRLSDRYDGLTTGFVVPANADNMANADYQLQESGD